MDIQHFQIVTVVVFLAILLAAQLLLKRLRTAGGLPSSVKRMEVLQNLSVGPKERLLLVRVDGSDFLVGVPRHGPLTLQPLAPNSTEVTYV